MVQLDTAVIALLISAGILILFITEWVPIGITAILAALAMAGAGIISFHEAFLGFSNDITLFVMGMTGIAGAMCETGAADYLGGRFIKHFSKGEKQLVLTLILLIAGLSAFISNTAAVALAMSVIASVCRSSPGVITKKGTYMALGFSSVVGGGCTLIGSTPQLIAQGLLKGRGLEGLHFFTLAIPGLVIVAALFLYYYCWAYDWQKKIFTFEEVHDTACEAMPGTEVKRSLLVMWTPPAIMLGCILCIVANVSSPGTIAMAGACLCVITRCTTQKKLLASIEWGTIFVLGGTFGFAAGIEKSGAGMLIANTVLEYSGGSIQPFALFVVMVLLSVLFTNVMSNTATIVIMLPLVLSLTTRLGYSHLPYVIGLVWGCSMAFATPIGTAPVTMTLVAGYRFTDYVRIGGVFTLIALGIVFGIVPLIFPF